MEQDVVFCREDDVSSIRAHHAEACRFVMDLIYRGRIFEMCLSDRPQFPKNGKDGISDSVFVALNHEPVVACTQRKSALDA